MSAFWWMGCPAYYPATGPIGGDLGARAYAFLQMPGTQLSPLTPGGLYPRIFTPLELAIAVFKCRKLICNYSFSVTDGADSYSGSGSFEVWNYPIDGITDEIGLISFLPGQIRPLGSNPGQTASFIQNGVGSTGGVQGLIWFCNFATFDAYYFDPINELVLPKVFLEILPYFNAGGVSYIATGDLTGDPSYNGPGEPTCVLETCNFLGTSIPVSVVHSGTLGAFSCSVTEAAGTTNAYWGWNGTWDTTSGAQLLDPHRIVLEL